MSTYVLNASARETGGKGKARKLRALGALPGVIYSAGNKALSISVNPGELEAIFRKTNDPNTVVSVELDGSVHSCLVKDVQRHPVSKVLRHIDFYEVNKKENVEVSIRVKTTGDPVGVKMGGTLRTVQRTLDVVCKPFDIPEIISVDVSEMNVGDFIKVSAIAAPKGCDIVYTADFNVIAVAGKRGGAEVETEASS